jgi:hypothetical protein
MDVANNDNFRTPAEHRAAVTAWAVNAPDLDHKVLPRKIRPARPRHRELADDLKPLLVWRALASAAEADFYAPGWVSSVAEDFGAANDNARADGDHEMFPTPEEIMERLDGVEMEWIPESGLNIKSPGRLIIQGGDVERNEDGILVRIGGLRLSGRSVGRVTAYRCEKRYRDRVVPVWVRAKERFVEQVGVKTPAPPRTPPVDPDESIDARREAKRLRRQLSPRTVTVLDACMRAASFEEIGRMLGKQGRNAKDCGKAGVIAACAELQSALDAAEMQTAA